MRTDDIVEIQQIIALYSHMVDMPDQTAFHLVFAEDAVFDGTPCGDTIHAGRAAIEAFFALGKPPHPLAHHMTNCWVYEKDGVARVKSKYMIRHPADGRLYFGDYDDEMVKTADGWRIRHRLVTPRDPAVTPEHA